MSQTNDVNTNTSVLHKEWTEGSIVKNLLMLAWPMIVMEATYMGSQLWDMLWVGKAGAASIAGLGIANLVLMIVSTVDMGIISGSRAMIARFIGEKDYEGARRVAGQTYIMAVGWGLIVSGSGYPTTAKTATFLRF